MARSVKPRSIVLATRNPHKIAEIKAILGGRIQYESIGDFLGISVKEAGRTLVDNSLTKAAFTFKVSGKPSLADDSGLFIEALDGKPGVYSARYGSDDNERITKVLKQLANEKNRRASFKAVFIYYYAPNTYAVFEGECRGMIADEPRGSSGFGYDPIFIPKGYSKTFAELGEKVKNRISHRAKALIRFKKYLTNL
ncbi:MAG: RdgB/HAM1 family non-canonical purine NTP pyrophosphatase [candidate division WOR-3 bacterium]|nr:MAG: RdgB/HAM1 family non-canonical purine NTP pyrophosphatase [candidate division WOR-3 bacterium]